MYLLFFINWESYQFVGGGDKTLYWCELHGSVTSVLNSNLFIQLLLSRWFLRKQSDKSLLENASFEEWMVNIFCQDLLLTDRGVIIIGTCCYYWGLLSCFRFIVYHEIIIGGSFSQLWGWIVICGLLSWRFIFNPN